MLYAFCGLALFVGLLTVKISQLSKKVDEISKKNNRSEKVKPFLQGLNKEQLHKLQAAVMFEGDFYSEFLNSLTEKQRFDYRMICKTLEIDNFTEEDLKTIL